MFLFIPLSLLQLALATLGQDVLTTDPLGGRMSSITGSAGCMPNPDMRFAACQTVVLGRPASVQFSLSTFSYLSPNPRLSDAADPTIMGWVVRFTPFASREQALGLLNPLLQHYSKQYPRREQVESVAGSSWTFTDTVGSMVLVEYKDFGLEHSITLTTTALAFAP